MFRPLEEGRGNRGNLEGVEVTHNINIYRLKVTLVTLVTSIFSRACRKVKHVYASRIHVRIPLLCKNEVTEVTEVTWLLLISVFRLPLFKVEVTWRYPRGNLRATFRPGGAFHE